MEETPIVPEEAIIPQDELDIDNQLDDSDDIEAIKEALTKEREAKRHILARAKKAEDLLKASGSQPKPVEPKPSQTSSIDIEETVLLANGMSEDLLSELKAVAKVRGLSLIKAQSDSIFVAIKDKIEKDKKQQEASMPAARGSGQAKVQKDFKSKGLTEAEHREMFESRFNR